MDHRKIQCTLKKTLIKRSKTRNNLFCIMYCLRSRFIHFHGSHLIIPITRATNNHIFVQQSVFERERIVSFLSKEMIEIHKWKVMENELQILNFFVCFLFLLFLKLQLIPHSKVLFCLIFLCIFVNPLKMCRELRWLL